MQPNKWEKTFANDTSNEELITKIYNEIIELKQQHKTNLIKKWADRPYRPQYSDNQRERGGGSREGKEGDEWRGQETWGDGHTI